MAEFQKVTEEAKRMCLYYTQKGSHSGCPMYPACNVSQCRKIAFERPAEFEGRVMKWAVEHPEPVYPTLAEWLRSIGLANHRMIDPIPADIAEKLGIEPREG